MARRTTRTTKAKATIPPPDYPTFDCAVYYPTVDTRDYFRATSDGGWLGTRCCGRTVQFLDGSCDPAVPAEASIVALTSHNSGASFAAVDGSVQVIPNDWNVQRGDLVFGLYQGGSTTETPAWFRGRVAHVHHHAADTTVTTTTPTLDIAYDDGEYECHIPLAYTIRIVATTQQHKSQWLHGVTVPLPGQLRRQGTTYHAESAIANVLPEGAIQLQYTSGDTGDVVTWNKRKSYQVVVQAVLQECQGLATRVCAWRAAQPPPTTTTTTQATPTTTTKRFITPSTTKSAKPSQHKKNPAPKRKKETMDEPDTPYATTTTTAFVHNTISRRPPSSRRSGRRAAATPAVRLCYPTSDVAAVPDPVFLEPAVSPRAAQSTSSSSTLPAADAVVYGEVLTGSDTVLASDWLTYLAERQDCAPHQDLWIQIWDVLSQGPMSDGDRYPDVRQMTLTLDYFERIVSKFGVTTALPLDGQDITDTILSHAQSSTFLYGEGVWRHATLHAKFCAVRALRHVLAAAFDEETDEEDIRDRLQLQQSPKYYVEAALAALASVSQQLDKADTDVDNDPCATLVYDLQQDLTTCLCYVCRWYSQEAAEDANAVADLLAQRHPASLTFLLQLKPRLLPPQVRPKLAERWGLAEEYNVVYG